MTNVILNFLAERKEARRKKPGERTEQEIEAEFHLPNWLTSAAKRACQLTTVTHPAKYSHPDADATAVTALPLNRCDGFVRTGNVPNVPSDVFGNAAALDAYAFLSLRLQDGRSVLDHLRDGSVELRAILDLPDDDFLKIREGFLCIESDTEGLRTDGRIKQVYFPIDTSKGELQYHLLSILTPSGLVFIHRERIRAAKFSDQTKQAREARKNNQFSESGYDDFPNLLTMNFGGSQPQNVSRLNSSNSGEALMLPSLPPNLANDYVRLPKRDFFLELRWDAELRSLVDSAHRIFGVEHNNVDIREAREYRFTQIFNWIFDRAISIQCLEPGWSLKETIQLPTAQRWWLDPESYIDAEDTLIWRQEIVDSSVRWILSTYRKMYASREDIAILGEADESRFQQELIEYIRENHGELL